VADLARLKALDPRSVWPHEAHDFTPWLLENADALAEVLGIDIELSAAEHPVGSFSLDLIGRDLTNDCVLMVENQLTTTDHGHLGQIVTYAAGTEARTILWLAPDFREEHRQALDFLNDLGGEDARFFGVEIGVVQIEGSKPAPLFKLRAQPNDWHAQVSAAAKTGSQQAGKAPLYQGFWTRFLERVHAEHPGWTNAHKPTTANWFNMPSPFPRSTYSVSFAAGSRLRSELYIDSGSAEENDALFNQLADHKTSIEDVYGASLVWEDLPGKRACRVADYRDDAQVTRSDKFDEYIDWFFDSSARLRNALASYAPTP
jgi:hypothetical protein